MSHALRNFRNSCIHWQSADTSRLMSIGSFSSSSAPKPPGWNPPDPQPPRNAEDEQPPGAFATFGLMGFGAIGAVGVAALGVAAVFQLANSVAAGTGRSLHKQREELEESKNIDLAKAADVAKHQAQQR